MNAEPELAATILNTALQLAEEQSWEQLRLQDITHQLNISLDDIRIHYAQKDDLVEAWFDRADSIMLKAAAAPEMIQLDMAAKLHHIIMAWLDALAPHRQVTADMLWYKLEPAHLHLQIQGILRISRTVQWFREAAEQDSTHLRRILEEVGLTSIYVATFIHWMNDTSVQQQHTRIFLTNRLRDAENCANRLWHKPSQLQAD